MSVNRRAILQAGAALSAASALPAMGLEVCHHGLSHRRFSSPACNHIADHDDGHACALLLAAHALRIPALQGSVKL